MNYLDRFIDQELQELSPIQGGLLIEGPKAIGKTESAKKKAKTQFNFLKKEDLELSKNQPEIILNSPPTILIDEWQLNPEIWNEVRNKIDLVGHKKTSFLLTGSSPQNFANLHSGAGRISRLQMRPLSFFERKLSNSIISLVEILNGNIPNEPMQIKFDKKIYLDEISRSGFPALRELSSKRRKIELNSYTDLIAEHDLVEIGFNIKQPALLKSWMKAFSASVGQTTSWEKIREAALTNSDLPMNRKTAQPYIEHLTKLRIIDDLQPWIYSLNNLGRLTQANKHFLADSALAFSLLDLKENDLSDAKYGPLVGHLFESLVTTSIRSFSDIYGQNSYHLRTYNGRNEVDLIVVMENLTTAFEIKFSERIDKGSLQNLLKLRVHSQKKIDQLIYIYTGSNMYKDENGILILPLAALGM